MEHHNADKMILVVDIYTPKVEVGSTIKFAEEKQKYTVMASNRFYSICTKPFNAKKTKIYTIVDWKNNIRGTENMIFGLGAETKEQCEQMLSRLTNAESDISQRNWVELNIDCCNLT